MTRLSTMLVLATAVLALALPASAGRQQQTALVGTVGTAANPEAFTIALRDASGNPVTHLDPGTYTITVHDFATVHNFHLFGRGVDQTTSVDGTGEVTWTVTFTDAVYKFQCDVHPNIIIGSFTAGTPPSPPPPPPVRKLTASVGPGAKIGMSAKKVPAGKYRITVRDRTAADNFHLTGPGVNRKTGIAFKGTAVWAVRLAKGKTYRFRSDANARLKGTLRVT